MIHARNKYGVAPPDERMHDGIRYHSKAEAQHAQRLEIEKAAGEIDNYRRQARVDLGPDFCTIIDFMVNEGGAAWHAREVKGYETAQFKRVKRLWRKYGPCPLHIIRNGKTIQVIEGAS